MNDRKTDYKKTLRQMIIRYIVAVSVLIILIIARQTIISYELYHNDHISSVINTAGRQRMLSQKITKDVLVIYTLTDNTTIQGYLEELKSSLSVWEENQSELQKGKAEGETVTNSAAVKALYQQVADHYKSMLRAAKDVVQQLEDGNYNKVLIKEKQDIILENEQAFLDTMDQIVNQYDEEARNKQNLIKALELILFIILLSVVLFEIIAVFIPTERTLLKATESIYESSGNLLKLFESVNEELILLDMEDLHILLLNDNARRMLEVESEDIEKLSLVDIINWETQDHIDLFRKLQDEEKMKDLEVAIKRTTGDIIYSLLSSVKGRYNDRDAILLTLNDITKKKEEENIIRNQAIKDELTGLYNRHFLDEILTEEFDRADRYNFPISIFIMDIDFFKRVNDTWGHPVGDIILKQTSELALQNIRKADYLFRIGGEEFLLFMPHVGLKQATAVAEKIRKEIEDYTHPVVGKYTASFGVAERMRGESFPSVYERADAAMYQAKQSGRNRVMTDYKLACQPGKALHLDWREEWNSGSEIIDEQHQALITLANEVVNLTLADIDEAEANQILDGIIQHVIKHFKEEEEILSALGYPYVKNHEQLHDELIKRAEQLEVAYIKKEVKLSAFFSFLLDEVIVGHMLDADTKFFPYIEMYNETSGYSETTSEK